jgi:hypothetical protein
MEKASLLFYNYDLSSNLLKYVLKVATNFTSASSHSV